MTNRFIGYGIPYADIVAIAVTGIELIGGIFMVLGFSTRFIAILFICIMAGAITFAKFELGFLKGYEIDVLIATMSAYLLIAGNKMLAVDNLFIERKKKK